MRVAQLAHPVASVVLALGVMHFGGRGRVEGWLDIINLLDIYSRLFI